MSTDNNIWMGDVEPWMNESFILQSFNYYNIHPSNVKLIHDKNTNELKNYCFINFDNIEEANKCIIMLNGKQIPNTKIKFKLNWATYFSSFNKSVYVGNLSPDVDDISLYKLFKDRYSSVHHASVITDKGKSKGFGFILFRGEKEYERCLHEMNGIKFHGNIIKVNEQKKKDDEIKNNITDNNDFIYNIHSNNNNTSHNYQNKANNHNENIIYNLDKSNRIKNNNINSNASNIKNNRNNINNYNSDQNSFSFFNNNNNQQNIINNIININNVNRINNINYINDINSIYNKNLLHTNNNLIINNNIIKNSINDITNNNLNISNHPSLYNNNYQNQIIDNNSSFLTNKKLFENNINNNNNNISSNNNINNINLNKSIKKKNNSPEYKLDILNKFDDSTLRNKIKESLDNMYDYYYEKFPGDINKLRCKYYYFYLNYYYSF